MARNARELVEQFPGITVDLETAHDVELLTHKDGRVWLNVDGVCLVRVRHCDGYRLNDAVHNQDPATR